MTEYERKLSIIRKSRLADFGILTESDGAFRSVYDIICDLSEKWDQMSQQDQIEVSK